MTKAELDELWKRGDITTGDDDYWEGDNVGEIMVEIGRHIEDIEMEDELRDEYQD